MCNLDERIVNVDNSWKEGVQCVTSSLEKKMSEECKGYVERWSTEFASLQEEQFQKFKIAQEVGIQCINMSERNYSTWRANGFQIPANTGDRDEQVAQEANANHSQIRKED